MSSELKPCPFCGSENIRIQPEGDYWEAYCIDCDVARQGFNYERMIDAWNERVNSNWIDVDDRLPEIQAKGCSKFVLVTFKSPHVNAGFVDVAAYTLGGWYDSFGYLKNVLAWQPLPEPYKKEETNDPD